jgi:cobyrinic acid a,c-diamide synthase
LRQTPGLILAAPASGSGKTTLALGLARALVRKGLRIAPAKVGPDYIDPTFHQAAAGRPCPNLDPWAMRPATRAGLVAELGQNADLVLCEGVMGLYDGIDAAGTASTAELAAETGWPILLVVDARGLAASVGPLVAGFENAAKGFKVVGTIANRVGSASHIALLREALQRHCPSIAFLGGVKRQADLVVPERHLGLVPAGERSDLEPFLERAADACAASLDLDAILGLARPSHLAAAAPPILIPPLGQHIAIAKDAAFVFAYPTLLESWRRQGASLSFFSPLADEPPTPDADAVFLPGGYPELHAATLAAAARFKTALRGFRGFVYGECGGYMTLGRSLEDASGIRHAMLDLLPIDTSFATRKLHLGYRAMRLRNRTPFGAAGAMFRGHEFHYSTVSGENPADALFETCDARGHALDSGGLRRDNFAGSFFHLIDRTEA